LVIGPARRFWQDKANAILKVSLDTGKGLRFLSLLESLALCRGAALVIEEEEASSNHPEVQSSPFHDPLTIQYAAPR
jgi:hypothetical protein